VGREEGKDLNIVRDYPIESQAIRTDRRASFRLFFVDLYEYWTDISKERLQRFAFGFVRCKQTDQRHRTCDRQIVTDELEPIVLR
jgi:hypothetical protein